jgi:hypothetical protein
MAHDRDGSIARVKAIATECSCSNDSIILRHDLAVKKFPNAMKILSDEIAKIVKYKI